jgi:hypothetical protein
VPDLYYPTKPLLSDETDVPLYIETHAHDHRIVFISCGSLYHGFELDRVIEPRGLSCIIFYYIKKLDPSAVLTFGVIEAFR